jgi:Domain of unknown function (DUF1707)
MQRGFRKTPVRVSDADRARALAQVDAMAAQGLIRDDDELKTRRQKISDALYAHEIQAALADLPKTLKQTDLPASDADRQDAIRQVRLHESVGHLTSDEADKRIEIISTCRTRESIAAVLADLPDVGQREVPHRISQRDRDEALKQIDEALLDGRITPDEHAAASAQVKQARTRPELNAAFSGLPNPTIAAARRKAVDAGRTAAEVSGRAVAEGGRRVSTAVARWIVAVVVAIVGIVTLILGQYLVGGVLLAIGVVIWLSSVAALFVSRRR